MDPVAQRIREAEQSLKQGQTVRWRQTMREAVALDAESPPTPERADAWAAHARADLPATERHACWVRAVAAASALGDAGRLARFTGEERRSKRDANAYEASAAKAAKARAGAAKKASAKPDKGAVGRWEAALRARLEKRFAAEDVDPDR
jgi:hypothetical protein